MQSDQRAKKLRRFSFLFYLKKCDSQTFIIKKNFQRQIKIKMTINKSLGEKEKEKKRLISFLRIFYGYCKGKRYDNDFSFDYA